MIKTDIHILVVDDQLENRLVLDDLLSERYSVQALGDGRELIHYLQQGGPVDLILLDVVMPGLDGFEACRQLKAVPATRDIPVIFLTSLESAADEELGLSLGAADFIHKPFSPAIVLARVRNQIELARTTQLLRTRNEDLERLVAERTREILSQAEELVQRRQQVMAAQEATIAAFCSLVEARDNETGNHIRRTQHYVRLLAEGLRYHPRFYPYLDEENIQMLYKAAPLHDIGKVAIPDAILRRPGVLTAEEWELMKCHCAHGRDIISLAEREFAPSGGSPYLSYAKDIAYSHHEHWDGSGYPEGLAGEAIPFGARLMAVADVYDALISNRVYKAAIPHDQALNMIFRQKGIHFDPDVVDALLDQADLFHAIAQRHRDKPDPAVGLIAVRTAG